MNRHLLNIVLLFALLFAQEGWSQVRFETKVSKSRLGINERLRVDFEMNQDGDNFRPPDFRDFRVIGGPNQAISNSYINGKRSFSKTYSYFLAPQKRGNMTIGQATIEIEGQIYKTSPVKVTITEAVKRSGEDADADYLASENVHLVAEVSKASPYLNEAITVSYRLYVSNEVSITSNWREIDTPKYADFWSQTIDAQGNYKIYEGTFRGEPYRYVVLRTTVLYPQKTGELEIEPLTLDVPIDVKSNRRDIFGRRLMTRVNKTISAGKRTIDVKPLPENGKPANFTGAVGKFDLEVNSNRTVLDAGESLELSVSVSGKGNLKLFDLPTVNFPSSLEVYEPTRADNISTQLSGMQGSMVEKYTVVPEFKGNYPIRPINFSYFDLDTQSYVTLSSDELVIDVQNGPLSAEEQKKEVALESGKQVVVLNDEQFKFIKLEGRLQAKEQTDFFRSTVYWALLGGPLLMIPVFILIGRERDRRRADVLGSKLRRANQLAKKYLSEAKKRRGDKSAFYEAMERALHNYLKAKLNIETSDMSKPRISELLRVREVEHQAVDAFVQLLKSCELARYTPTSKVTIEQDYQQAIQVLASIDKQIQ